MNGRLSDIATAMGARLHGADRDYAGASIDTRNLAAGALFFALPGSRVDGHDFVARAACLGAAAAVVSRRLESRLAQLVVADVEQALQCAGAYARNHFGGDVIGVTGSNGKTTVKQMLAAICAADAPVLATAGNRNNHLGVPLTLMRLAAGQARAVIEMGASHAGEIAALCKLARPRIGVVTNAGAAHLEGFGSRDGVAEAKGEMFAGLPEGGVAVINADDVYAPRWREIAGARRVLDFGIAADAAIRAEEPVFTAAGSRFRLLTPAGSAVVALPLAGRHNVANALAAAAAAHAAGIDTPTIATALAGMAPVDGRLAITAGRHGVRLVDDSYNANPGSLAAALGWLADQPGVRWAVLGDMGELGDYAAAAHRDAGTAARAAGIDRLWATGEHSRATVEAFGEGGLWFADHAALAAALEQALVAEGHPVTVLVKGSRSAHMDRIADGLRSAPDAQAGASC